MRWYLGSKGSNYQYVPLLIWYDIRFYILYIIYAPNLGLGIADFVWGRERGRFEGSSEGGQQSKRGEVKGENQRAVKEQQGASREAHIAEMYFSTGSMRQHGPSASIKTTHPNRK